MTMFNTRGTTYSNVLGNPDGITIPVAPARERPMSSFTGRSLQVNSGISDSAASHRIACALIKLVIGPLRYSYGP